MSFNKRSVNFSLFSPLPQKPLYRLLLVLLILFDVYGINEKSVSIRDFATPHSALVRESVFEKEISEICEICVTLEVFESFDVY